MKNPCPITLVSEGLSYLVVVVFGRKDAWFGLGGVPREGHDFPWRKHEGGEMPSVPSRINSARRERITPSWMFTIHIFRSLFAWTINCVVLRVVYPEECSMLAK